MVFQLPSKSLVLLHALFLFFRKASLLGWREHGLVEGLHGFHIQTPTTAAVGILLCQSNVLFLVEVHLNCVQLRLWAYIRMLSAEAHLGDECTGLLLACFLSNDSSANDILVLQLIPHISLGQVRVLTYLEGHLLELMIRQNVELLVQHVCGYVVSQIDPLALSFLLFLRTVLSRRQHIA